MVVAAVSAAEFRLNAGLAIQNFRRALHFRGRIIKMRTNTQPALTGAIKPE